MQAADSELLIEQKTIHGAQVLWLSINREARRNAMSHAVLQGIATEFERANSNREIRAIVLTGVGEKAFCAGADLQSSNAFVQDYSDPQGQLARVLRAAKALTTPLIARVNGACMAGGMGLMSMCDMAVAAEHAVFGLPEVKLGLFPAQVLAALQHLIPRRKLLEMCITGEPLSAAEALSIGLVNHIDADVDAKLDWLLSRLLDKSPSANRRGLYMMKKMECMSFEEAISFAESQIALFTLHQDAQEGQRAFQEKRRPVWVNR
jgi:enoyl-CoA hydratase/carnithine racemase